MKRRMSSSQGSALLFTIVLSGVLAALASWIAYSVNVQTVSMTSLDRQISVEMLSGIVRNAFATPTICSSSLVPGTFNTALAITPAGTPISFNIPGVGVLGAGQTLAPLKLMVTSLQFANARRIARTAQGHDVFLGTLVLTGTYVGTSNTPLGLNQVALQDVMVTASGTSVSGCYAQYSIAGMCGASGGVVDVDTGTCTVPPRLTQQVCPAGQFLKGIDERGVISCG